MSYTLSSLNKEATQKDQILDIKQSIIEGLQTMLDDTNAHLMSLRDLEMITSITLKIEGTEAPADAEQILKRLEDKFEV